MKKFAFSFVGRQTGAIGITYQIKDTYRAHSLGAAMYMLYTDYDLIHRLEYRQGAKKIDTEGIELVKCDISKCYPNRPTNPQTGSYLYTRSDTPIN